MIDADNMVECPTIDKPKFSPKRDPNDKPKRVKREPITKEQIRAAAKQAQDCLHQLTKDLADAQALLGKVASDDAQFATRESLKRLLETLDKTNVEMVIRNVHMLHSKRLVDRAAEG